MSVLEAEACFVHLDELVYCLGAGFPADVTLAFLALVDDQELLVEARDAWDEWGEHSDNAFVLAVRKVTGLECWFCVDCDNVVWLGDTTLVTGDKRVCDDSCLSDYTKCGDCGDLVSDTVTVQGDAEVCGDCLDNYYSCHRCNEWVTDVERIAGYRYCESCRDNYFTWCDNCDEYFPDEDGHDHDYDDEDDGVCGCVAPNLRFEFPANGAGVVREDERIIVRLPQGTIDDQGLYRIRRLLNKTHTWDVVNSVIESVGPMWQTKRGNFTRRLANAFYKNHAIRVAPEVISEIGNIARAHSTTDSSVFHVEFTRDLNQSAEAFYHGDSCWFTGGSYGDSRCCLKNWGGLAMRTYSDDMDRSDCPSGRTFIQPLDTEMRPTHDTIGAHAYMVFNGYGNLDGDGYIAARVVAHLTGMSYRKIPYCVNQQYINGDKGVLVADEATCEATPSIHLSLNKHESLDAHRFNFTMRAAA